MVKRILIVDNEECIRKTGKRFIDAFFKRYKVDMADDGSTAIALMKKNDYSAIISDYSMPHINGNKLYEWIAQNQPSKVGKFAFAISLQDHDNEDFVKKNKIRLIPKGVHFMDPYVNALEEILGEPRATI
ncbi:MAG: response regulator [Nanoarchaeota archaeon]|nr:response regulator [Nanoarchaeota archaeon]